MSTNENEKDKNTRIDLGDVTPHNIKLLKKVNQVVFPIVYHDKFYKDVLEAGELAKLAYYNDVVGKIWSIYVISSCMIGIIFNVRINL